MQFSKMVFTREFPEVEGFIYSGNTNEAHQYLEPLLNTKRPPTNAMLAKANVWAVEGQFEKAIQVLRTALPDARGQMREQLRFYLQRLLCACSMTAEAFDLYDGATPKEGLKVFISGGVGSGFDGVGLGLSEVLHWSILRAIEGGFQNEADIRIATLESLSDKGCVISQSSRCTESNILALQVFSPRVVLVCRNIYDCLGLLVMHLKEEGDITGFLRDEVKNWAPEQILSYVVDKWASWYVSHYASWWSAHNQGRLDVLFLEYEDWVRDPQSSYMQIIEHTRIDAQIDVQGLNSHKPIVMRTEENYWTDVLKERVKARTQAFSEVDFSQIGM